MRVPNHDRRSSSWHAIVNEPERSATQVVVIDPPATQTVPVPLTRPIGRSAEIASIRAQVTAKTRLLTLCGPGGVGKTRLALAAAADLRDAFAGDVAFVDCVSFVDATQLVPAIARALRLDHAGVSTLDVLINSLAERRSLLVLDNLEQIAGADGLVSRLVSHTRRLVIVGTSRVRLDVPSESVLDVAPLPTSPVNLPDGPVASPAVELFVERAQATYPSFALTAANAAVVEAICGRLDGLPLAIELAAARVPVMAPATMLTRIERQLTIIDGGDRSLPDRHRSLRATLDWSYHLLTAPQQRRFRHLAIFAGSFDQAAAGAILEADADGPSSSSLRGRQVSRWLATSQRQSLLTRLPATTRGGHRYAMLETIRTHARTLLRDDPDWSGVADRHLDWYFRIAVEAETNLNGRHSARWLARMDQDIANLRQALRYATDSDRSADGLTLAVSMWRYWESRGLLQEGVDAFERLLAQDTLNRVGPALRGTALNHLANLLTDLGEFRRAAGLYDESLALRRQVGAVGPVADTLNNLGLLSAAFGNYDLARTQFREALAIRRAEHDRWGEALALANLGDVAVAEGNAEPAVTLQEEALAIRTVIGDERGIAFSISNLAEACRLAGDRLRASQLLGQADRRFQRLGLPLGEALVHRNRGDLEGDDGRPGPAFVNYHAALFGFRRLGDRGRLAEVLERIGAALVQAGGVRSGLAAIGAAEAIRIDTGFVRAPADGPRVAAALEAGQRELGSSITLMTLRAGRGMLLEQAMQQVDAAIGDLPTSAPGTDASRDGRLAGLSDREQEVLGLLAEGLTNAEIAHQLYVSAYTVSAHLRRIFRQLGVTTRTAAMQHWLRDVNS